MQLFDPITHDLREERETERQSERAEARVRTVGSVMSTPVHVCTRLYTVADALRRMKDHAVGVLPVLDEDARVAGLVTDRDLAFALLAGGEAPERVPIGQVMTQPVVTVGRDEPIARAASLMVEHGARRIPVVDPEGRPIGLVSLSDLIRVVAAGAHGIDWVDLARVASAVTRRPVG